MQNSLLKKGMILGIIMLFVGTGVLPSVIGDIEQKITVRDKMNSTDYLDYKGKNSIEDNPLSVIFEVRESGGGDDDWKDDKISADVGTILEFRISLSLQGDHEMLFIVVELPSIEISDVIPMFDYIEGSADPIPIGEEGTFFGTNLGLVWQWESDSSTWANIYKFKAKIAKAGTRNVNLTVVATKPDPQSEPDYCQKFLTVTGTDGCCFPAGTKITMADGSNRNIEEIMVGDLVKSFNEDTQQFENHRVLEIESPVREGYYELHNNDEILVKVTNEHPFYCRKVDGSVCWCSIEPEITHEYYPGLYHIRKLNLGDFIYKDDETWVQLTSWNYVEGPIQTYNLEHIEDTHTFFADGLLVHNKCFPEGTQITMADGTKRNIEDVEIGDKVLTYNEKTELKEFGYVTDIESPIDDHLYIINDGIIKTTRDHPFYTRKSDGEIVWAAVDKEATIKKMPYLFFVEELNIGDEIFTDEGTWVKICKMEYEAGEFQVYNLLGITNNPNFYANGFLVHNRCCFAAGTKITMADGSFKNIEDIEIGDRVLSYNVKHDRYNSWIVTMFGRPTHPVYDINEGLIQATVNHPFVIKTIKGNIRLGVVSPCNIPLRLKLPVRQIEIGDSLYIKDEKWVKIYDISFNSTPVQTYNIMSLSGIRTYFANNILVFEENAPIGYWIKNRFLNQFFENHPHMFPLLRQILRL